MPFDIQSVRSHFPDRKIHYVDSIDTTMRISPGPSGTTLIAEEQTAGQGRHGHTWHSEKSLGLYVSIVLDKTEPTPTLTMALGLAVAEAITSATGLACDLRWPNDVMIGGRKAAGILAQSADSAAIAGIGINVNHRAFPPDLSEEATSLRLDSGRDQSP